MRTRRSLNPFVERLKALPPGHAITFRFDQKIVGRFTYGRVQTAASKIFGAGNYRMSKPAGSTAIRVARLR